MLAITVSEAVTLSLALVHGLVSGVSVVETGPPLPVSRGASEPAKRNEYSSSRVETEVDVHKYPCDETGSKSQNVADCGLHKGYRGMLEGEL